MKRSLIIILIFISILIIGYFGFIWALESCEQPVLPVPMPISSLTKFHVMTDQGALYFGQTYRYRNEGPWVGDITLVAVNTKRATLLVRYPADYPMNRQKEICKDYYP